MRYAHSSSRRCAEPMRKARRVLTAPAFPAHPGLRHAFFTREGGVSEGRYASMNCGLGSADEPDRVRENRARAMSRLGLPAEALVTARQVHSSRAAVVDHDWGAERPQVDGLATRTPGMALGILTADCAPVLFADVEAGVIGAAHAGWRGAKGGILEATVAAMETLGARRTAVGAAVGPCIRRELIRGDCRLPRSLHRRRGGKPFIVCPWQTARAIPLRSCRLRGRPLAPDRYRCAGRPAARYLRRRRPLLQLPPGDPRRRRRLRAATLDDRPAAVATAANEGRLLGQLSFAPCFTHRRMISICCFSSGRWPCGIRTFGSARPSTSTSRLLLRVSPGTTIGPCLVPVIKPL